MAIKETWDQFCNETTLLCMQYLKSDYRPAFRIFSTFVVAFSIGITIYPIMDRIFWYSANPVTVNMQEFQLDTVEFPTIEICNSMQYMLSKTNASSAESYLSDFTEIFAKLTSSNKTAQSSTLITLKRFPAIAQKLRQLAKTVNDSKNVTLKNCGPNQTCMASHDAPDSWHGGTYSVFTMRGFTPMFSNESDKFQYEVIKQQLGTILPMVFNYLHFFKEYIGFGMNNTDLILWENNENLINNPESRKSFLSWKKRFEMAADILDSVTKLNLHNLSKTMKQNQTEFIKSCKWLKSNTDFRIKAIEKKGNLCYRIISPEILFGPAQQSVSLILDLQQYDGMPGSPSGTAKVSRVPQNCKTIGLKYFDDYSEGQCIFEKHINRKLKSCGCGTSEVWNTVNGDKESLTNRTTPCNFLEEIECQISIWFTRAYIELYEISDESTRNKCNPNCHTIHYQADLTAGNLNMKELFQRLPTNFENSVNISLWKHSTATHLIRSDLFQYRQWIINLLFRSFLIADKLVWLNKKHLLCPEICFWFPEIEISGNLWQAYWKNYTDEGEYLQLNFSTLLNSTKQKTDFLVMNCSNDERTNANLKAPCFLLENADYIIANWSELLPTMNRLQTLAMTATQDTIALLQKMNIAEPEAANLFAVGTLQRDNVEKFMKEAARQISRKVYETRGARHLSVILLDFAKLLEEDSLQHIPALDVGVPLHSIKNALYMSAVYFNSSSKKTDEMINLWKRENMHVWLSEFLKVIDELMIYYPGKQYMQKNCALVRIYYERMNSRVFHEQPAYSTTQLISDFGSVVGGILLGASAVTVTEFIYALVNLCVFFRSKQNKSLFDFGKGELLD